MTVADVAARLGACTATVYKLCAKGVLAHVRILNSIRFTQESVEAFIASNRYAALLPTAVMIPAEWPDARFDLVWVFDLDPTSSDYRSSQVPQLVLSGDKRV